MMKPYPTYKESGDAVVDKVPEHWSVTKLKRITEFLYGNSLPKDRREEGDVPVYGSNGITGFHTQAITDSPCIVIGRKGSFGKVNFSKEKCFPIDTTFYVDRSATNNNVSTG